MSDCLGTRQAGAVWMSGGAAGTLRRALLHATLMIAHIRHVRAGSLCKMVSPSRAAPLGTSTAAGTMRANPSSLLSAPKGSGNLPP